MNKHRPHVWVIPEDRADEEIANGFVLHPRVDDRRVRVVEPAGGWPRVLEMFKEEYVPQFGNPNIHVVLIVDFDGDPVSRRARFEEEIPEPVRNRVFVLGPRDTPESLKQALEVKYETIGWNLAEDCFLDQREYWDHEQLSHNEQDRVRLTDLVKPFLIS